MNCGIYLNINIFCSSQDNLLSDEEAKEIKKLLSPTDNDQLNTSDWMSEVLSIESNDNITNQRYMSLLMKLIKELVLWFFKFICTSS